MGAVPAREIVKIQDSNIEGLDPFIIVKGIFGQEVSIELTELPRTELIRVASMVFPPASRPWTRYDNSTIRQAIRSKTLPGIIEHGLTPLNGEVVPADACVACGECFGPDDDFASHTCHLVPQVVSAQNGNVIESAIRAIAEAAAQSSINETRVKELIAESDIAFQVLEQVEKDLQPLIDVAIMSLRPHFNYITIPDHETVTLPGRQHKEFASLLKLISLRRNVYLVGPPGTGKTFMAHEACKALSLDFGAISCSPTMPDSRLFGYMDANGHYVRTVFRDRFEYGGGFLFDEADNGHPGVLAAINQALANSQCAFPDGMVAKHESFFAMMAGNTYGTGATRQFIGRNELDFATRNRFVFVEVDIDEDLETSLTLAELPGDMGMAWLSNIRRWRANAQTASLNWTVTPRNAVNGAMMLAAGFAEDQVITMAVRQGLGDDQWRKVSQS